MIYVFLAPGFEECEALAPVDILRRGGLDVKTVGVSSKTVVGSHCIPVVCDITINDAVTENLEAVILPGGMPGTTNLENNQTVQKFIDYAVKKQLIIGAICAAPSILGHKNLLNGKNATCYDGFDKDLYGAQFINMPVVSDDNYITAYGAGAAYDFGFELLSKLLKSKEKSDSLKIKMKYNKL